MMITLDAFGGMRPILDTLRLDPEDAANASGVVLGAQSLDPENIPLPVTTLSLAGTIQSIFYLASIWLQWTSDVDVVRSPVAAVTNRVHYTGDSFPKSTDFTLATTGPGTDYPNTWYKLGVDAPAVAASLTVAGGTGATEARSYVYTFVSGWSEEGPPSPALTQTGFQNGTWNFNGMATANPANHNITKKRIYRTVTATDGSVSYLFVAEITLATANYADVIVTTALGEVLPSTDWVAPDATMTGLISLPGGILAGKVGNEICFSEPYQPHAWPAAYRIPVDYPIVGLGASNSNLVACTTGTPYIVTGSDPSSMSITKVDAKEPCISKRSIVDFGFGVAYASPNGLVIVSTQGTANVTETIMTRDQWQKLVGYTTYLSAAPQITAAKYRGKYLFFSAAGSLLASFGIVDKQNKPSFYYGALHGDGGLARAKALFVNQEFEDQLYYCDNSKRVLLYGYPAPGSAWDANFQPVAGGLNYHVAQWTSRKFKLPKAASLAYVRVEADLSNAHAAYLSRDDNIVANSAIKAATNESPIAGHTIAEDAIAGGAGVPIFAPGQTLIPFAYQQGYVRIDVYAGNSGGHHGGTIDAVSFVDSFYVVSGAAIAIASIGKYDVWQVYVQATCRVKRIQLAESAQELQGA